MGRAWLGLLWSVPAVACSADDIPGEVPCVTDKDCPPDIPHCKSSAMPDRPAVVVCEHECSSDAECGVQFYCENPDSCSHCEERCNTAGCAEGLLCQADGTCLLVACDDPRSLDCPMGWRCDPAATAAAAGATPAPITGSKVTPNDWLRTQRGCAPDRCDDAAAPYPCDDLWRCDPTHSTYPSGCVPLPCSDTGRCSDDSRLICAKPDDARASTADPNGCVPRNCNEGFPCSSDQICDHGACRNRTCAERTCSPGYVCVDYMGFSSCNIDNTSSGGSGPFATGFCK